MKRFVVKNEIFTIFDCDANGNITSPKYNIRIKNMDEYISYLSDNDSIEGLKELLDGLKRNILIDLENEDFKHFKKDRRRLNRVIDCLKTYYFGDTEDDNDEI